LKEYDEEGKEKDKEKEVIEITSDFTNNFIYRKIKIVECKNFDKNIKNVYGTGIHYYLLWTSAFQLLLKLHI